MRILAGPFAKLSPHLAHRPGAALATRAHALALRASRGRVGRRVLGADVLVLRTVGRRTGEPRDAPLFYVPHAGGWAVVASNAASARPPAWWLNLQARPAARVMAGGRWHEVRGRRATEEEQRVLWPRFAASYVGYDIYRQRATREMPVVVLERA